MPVITFDEAEAYLASLINYEQSPAQTAMGRYLHLDRMREALARVGSPQMAFRCLHIAGTKGKGSTAAMAGAMLRAAGRRVGLYTSPHLITVRERLQIDGEPIAEAELAALVEEIRPILEGMRGSAVGAPTFFETYTLLALRWFARRHVEIAVLETGMGGRLDATNVVQPLATALTTIALDHTAELGESLSAIAGEKAGIIKPGVPVVSAPQAPEAAEVIARIAAEKGCPLYRVGQEITIQPLHPVEQIFSVHGRLGSYLDLSCPLLGAHQQLNAAVAIGLLECVTETGEPITAEAMRAGLAGVRWPGRLQVLQERPLLILDGAHDPASIEALLAALARHFPARRRRYILGFSREKDWPRMLRQLAPSAAEFIVTAVDMPRAVPPAVLAEEAAALGVPVRSAPDVAGAVQLALVGAEADDLLCVTGSLYVVGDALRSVKSEKAGISDHPLKEVASEGKRAQLLIRQ